MQTTPKRFGVAANELKRSERLLQDRQQSYAPSLGSAQPRPHRHHVDTLEELRAGCELIELYYRASPGFLAGRRHR